MVIVGGGVAGLSAALNLRQMGVDVVLVDAVTQHRDGACASAGIIAPQLVRNSPRTVLSKLGRDRGDALMRMIAESGNYLFETLKDHNIACDARQAGFLAPIAGRGKVQQLEALIAEWRPWRSDLSLLRDKQVELVSSCAGYDAALVDASGGGVDPAALVDGLEDAAIRLGARIYRGAPVERIDPENTGWRVVTANGSISANQVLLCANGGNSGLHPKLRGTILPLPVVEVATRPLPEDLRAAILPGGQTLTDISTDIFSLRLTADGRLITALGVSGATRSSDEIEQAVQARLERMLPSYRRVPLEYIWQGTAWINTSFLPRIVTLGEGLAAVQACNGRGLANNMIIGREMARWLHNPDYVPMVAIERPKSVPGFALMQHLPRLIMVGSGALRSVFDRAAGRQQAKDSGR